MNDLHRALDQLDWRNTTPWIVMTVVGLVGLAVYFAPYLIARARRHRQRAAIFWLNVLVGWTFFGWVAAWVWAFIVPDAAVIAGTARSESAAEELGLLAALRDKGVLDEEEFQRAKRNMLRSAIAVDGARR